MSSCVAFSSCTHRLEELVGLLLTLGHRNVCRKTREANGYGQTQLPPCKKPTKRNSPSHLFKILMKTRNQFHSVESSKFIWITDLSLWECYWHALAISQEWSICCINSCAHLDSPVWYMSHMSHMSCVSQAEPQLLTRDRQGKWGDHDLAQRLCQQHGSPIHLRSANFQIRLHFQLQNLNL